MRSRAHAAVRPPSPCALSPGQICPVLFFFPCYGAHRALHSFPTRRSSDLPSRAQRRNASLWISQAGGGANLVLITDDDIGMRYRGRYRRRRSEEHTSELQSPYDLVCRLLLEKKKRSINHGTTCDRAHTPRCGRLPRVHCRQDRSALSFFFFPATAPTAPSTLSLHDALPICPAARSAAMPACGSARPVAARTSSSLPTTISACGTAADIVVGDRKSTRLNSSHRTISYAVFCLKKKKEA